MSSCWLSIFAAAALSASFDDAPGIELRYTGALARAGRNADDAPVKRFSLYALRESGGARRVVHVIGERGAGAWSWPERYAAVPLDNELQPGSASTPKLLYEYEGNPLAIPLPFPVAGYFKSLEAGAKWTSGKESWEVVRQQKMRDRNCWQVQVSTSFGRKRTVWVDVELPVVVALEERVFVGQGDEHLLTMQLESIEPLDDERLARDTRPLETALKRNEHEFRPELNDTQLKLAADALPVLQKQADDTPFSALVTAIAKDVKGQMQRTDDVARLAEKFVGQPAPAFSLNLIDKKQVDAASLKGRIVVLHFWEYQGEPLVEPYGQVGYLDFLYGKRKKLGVDVYGVAVDRRLAEEQSAGAALKSFRRLTDFMRLSYPLAVDEGKLLARFGDPQKYGAKLPLWVVIAPDGTIAHYHAGFYKINPDEGLQQLDEVLVKLIRDKREKE
jgi:peroxiredoxin